jgi:hypothetical protein
MIRATSYSLFLCFLPYAATAQPPSAANWTLEERLARRNDPADVARRAYVNARRMTPGPQKPPDFIINGGDDPELFLPFELMNMLLDSMHDRTEAYRHRTYDPVLADLRWDRDEFWTALRQSGADYFRLNESIAEGSPSDALSRQICAARAAAHEGMRKRYPHFDEFLYAAVAPNRVFASDETASAHWLPWLEGGCR